MSSYEKLITSLRLQVHLAIQKLRSGMLSFSFLHANVPSADVSNTILPPDSCFAFCFFYASRRSNRSSNWLQIMYLPSMNVPTGSFRLAGQRHFPSRSSLMFTIVYSEARAVQQFCFGVVEHLESSRMNPNDMCWLPAGSAATIWNRLECICSHVRFIRIRQIHSLKPRSPERIRLGALAALYFIKIY